MDCCLLFGIKYKLSLSWTSPCYRWDKLWFFLNWPKIFGSFTSLYSKLDNPSIFQLDEDGHGLIFLGFSRAGHHSYNILHKVRVSEILLWWPCKPTSPLVACQMSWASSSWEELEAERHPRPQTKALAYANIIHRITESFGWEGTSVDHQVQFPAKTRFTQSRLHRIVFSIWIFPGMETPQSPWTVSAQCSIIPTIKIFLKFR